MARPPSVLMDPRGLAGGSAISLSTCHYQPQLWTRRDQQTFIRLPHERFLPRPFVARGGKPCQRPTSAICPAGRQVPVRGPVANIRIGTRPRLAAGPSNSYLPLRPSQADGLRPVAPLTASVAVRDNQPWPAAPLPVVTPAPICRFSRFYRMNLLLFLSERGRPDGPRG